MDDEEPKVKFVAEFDPGGLRFKNVPPPNVGVLPVADFPNPLPKAPVLEEPKAAPKLVLPELADPNPVAFVATSGVFFSRADVWLDSMVEEKKS